MAKSGPTEAEQIPPPSEEKLQQWRSDYDYLKEITEHVTIVHIERFWQTQNKNPTGDDVKAVLQAADKDGNGEINFEEFVEIQRQAEQLPFYSADIKEELLAAFSAYDTNGDGWISKDELKEMLCGFDDSEIDDFIKEADTDGNGKLSIIGITERLESDKSLTLSLKVKPG